MSSDGERLGLVFAATLVALTGFIALSCEILWYRAYSFVMGGSPATFGVVLGIYLLGIAIGSFTCGRFCTETASRGHTRVVAWFVILASGLGFLVVPALGWLATIKWGLSLPLMGIAAAVLGATFPLISHLAISPNDDAGQRLSWLYVANIVGSASGSLITGFVLMDVWSIRAISVFLALLGLAIGATLLAMSGASRGVRLAAIGAGSLVGVVVWLLAPALFHDLYAKLQYKRGYLPDRSFAYVVETKSGVVTVEHDGRLFGGGVIDGAFSTSLIDDKNGIVRAYAILGFHPRPRNVLMIGLSSGSWAQVIANHPQVESLTVIEINPGYLELIPRYPSVASVLRNPKVEIVIDDGRRWLARSAGKKFDLIVQNTTWHWRAHVTNLLSTEYLELVRARLGPGGVFYFNTTASPEVQKTAATSFPHALRIGTFVAVSDAPLTLDRERLRLEIEAYRIDGAPVLDVARADDRAALAKVMSYGDVEPRDAILARTSTARIITDDNMASEWQRALYR